MALDPKFKIDPSRIVPAEVYLKQHPQPVILHAQPKSFVRMETPEQLRNWEQMIRETVGLSVNAADGGSYTQTISAPPPGAYEIPDDCESD